MTYIALDNMSGLMVINLFKAGHQICGFDRLTEPVALLVDADV